MVIGSGNHTRSKETFSWLITGGCGFIGRNLIQRLLTENGHKIRVLDNLSVGTTDDLGEVCRYSIIGGSPDAPGDTPPDPKSVELFIGDITDPSTCRKASVDTDIIVHLAANTGVGPSVEDPRADMETNVTGTFNLLEAAKHNNVARFVFASSGAPIGECEPPIHEELAPHPVSPYGASKLAGEGYCSAFYRTFGLETVALRFGNVYGPLSGKKNSVIAKFIKNALNGEPLEIYGDGTQTRDFIYIDDLVDAIYKAGTLYHSRPIVLSHESAASCIPAPISSNSKLSLAGEIFQIATNKETTVAEIINILIPILKKSGIEDIRVVNVENRIGDVRRNFSDTTKAREMLGWQCTNALPKGISKTVDWFC